MVNRKTDNNHSLRILILNGDLPVFPGWGGIEFLHTTHFAQMAQKVGLVSVVQTIEQMKKKKGLADAGVNLFLWENPNMGFSQSAEGKKQNLVRRIAKFFYSHFRKWPPLPQDTLIQNFQFCNMSVPLLKALKSEKWQALVVVQSCCAYWLDYLPSFPARVLVLHDVRALMYERRAKSAESLSQQLFYKLQATLYRNYERRYCRKYDLVVTVSQVDEAWVRKYYQPKKVVTIPIPVDCEYFAPMPEEPVVKDRIVFTGMMNHPPNVNAAIFFAHKVFPKVQAIIPSAEFWIVGRNPSLEVRKLADLGGVKVTGFVSDIRPYIAQSTVLVVPILFGAGMRQKILEAWAMGKCVISTKIGAEGIDYQDNVNILIADDAKIMTSKVLEVIQNPELSERIGTRGRDLVTSKHNPDILSKNYYNAIESEVLEKHLQNEPMKVLIDLRWMLPGLAGGIENLARSFIKCLLRVDRFNNYSVLLPTQVKCDYDLRDHSNFCIYPSDGPAHYWRKLLWWSARFLHSSFKLPFWWTSEVETLRRSNVMDAEVALSIPGYIHPELFPMTNVLIVPDIQHEYHPEFFTEEDLRNRKRLYSDSIKHADHICAISNFTRQTLIDRYMLPPDRVTTTHLAADPIFHPDSIFRGNPKPVLNKYGIESDQYLLFPGNTWSHKNHFKALEALKILRKDYNLEPMLVCTGASMADHQNLLITVNDLGLDNQVKFLGYCPAQDMPALYEGSNGLLYPSFFEGFGLPLLEAMWCHCPIACSHVTSHPEIAGDAALMFDPHSEEEMAAVLSKLLTDSNTRKTLIARGLKQAKKFSWLNFTIEIVRTLYELREKKRFRR